LISLKIKLSQVLARKQNQEKDNFYFLIIYIYIYIFWLEKTDAVISLTSEQIEVIELED